MDKKYNLKKLTGFLCNVWYHSFLFLCFCFLGGFLRHTDLSNVYSIDRWELLDHTRVINEKRVKWVVKTNEFEQRKHMIHGMVDLSRCKQLSVNRLNRNWIEKKACGFIFLLIYSFPLVVCMKMRCFVFTIRDIAQLLDTMPTKFCY